MSDKSRLTITLPNDLLQKVDALIDKRVIRNRSHAIEHLIDQSLGSGIQQAVILSWGNAQQSSQHSLKKIQEKHLLSLTIDHLQKHGIREVIICAGKSNAHIQKIFGDRTPQGIQLKYVEEDEPLGTAGALKKAEPHLHKLPFLVLHGDTLTNLNLTEFMAFHAVQATLATIAVKPRLGEEKFGQVFMQGDKIKKFSAVSASQGISIINTGIYIFEPSILSMIPPNKKSNLEEDIFPRLAERNELSAFIFQGLWYDISEREEYKKAQQRW